MSVVSVDAAPSSAVFVCVAHEHGTAIAPPLLNAPTSVKIPNMKMQYVPEVLIRNLKSSTKHSRSRHDGLKQIVINFSSLFSVQYVVHYKQCMRLCI